MPPKDLFRRILLVALFTGLVLFLIFLSLSIIREPIKGALIPFVQDTAVSQKTVGLPARLKIPRINIDAAVEFTGLASNGEMGVPKNNNNVAWFELSPRPGERGSAVIAGHFDGKDGSSAVFNNLDKLRPGDKLYIEDSKGEAISFVVRESRSYKSNADALMVFSSNDGQAHLNLITCEGVWNKTVSSYSRRLVVFADKEAEQ